MYIDSFTISAILVSLAVIAGLIYIIVSSHRRMEAKLRRYAAQQEYIKEQSACGDYCIVLRQMYPDAFPGIDYVVRDEGTGPHIVEWYLRKPRPSEAEIQRRVEQLRQQQP